MNSGLAVAPAGALTPPPGELPPRPGVRFAAGVTVLVVLLVDLLVLAGVPAPVRAVVVLPAVVLLPGAWILRLLRLRRPAGWDVLLHAVAFGLCCLLLVSFVVATLPIPGALSPAGCLVGFDLAMAALLTAVLRRDRRSSDRSAGAVAPSPADVDESWALGPEGPWATGVDAPQATGVTGPWFAGANGPRVEGAEGAPVAGATGPWFAGANGPRVEGADGPGVAGANGPRVARADGPPVIDLAVAPPAGGVAAHRARWWTEARGLRAYLPAGRVHPPPGSTAVGLAALAVVGAVFGALRLNAGGGSTPTALALTVGAMALLTVALSGRGGPDDEHAHEQATATTVYLLGLAVLLATSLRGIGVTGHDIKIEMHVLQATLAAGRWQPGGFAPDYTACLSITTLPAFLHHLLGLPPLDIFRVCYQVLFAVVPVGVFLLARRLLPIGGAAAAAGLFIAFPTFVNDMPMLNRQELALIFFTVAMVTLLDQHGSRRDRLVTFVTVAAGLTVSHYSSTYVTVGMLLVGWLVLRWTSRADSTAGTSRVDSAMGGRPRHGRLGWLLGRVPVWHEHTAEPPLLGLRLVLLLVAFSVGWSICSGSGGGLLRTVSDTVVAVQRSNGASADAVGYSVFGPRTVRTDAQVLRSYVDARSDGTDPHVLDRLAITCPTSLTPADLLPVTRAGRLLESADVTPAAVNVGAREGAVGLFQLGAVLGVVLLWLSTRRLGGPGRVLAALGAGALGLLAATVVLPELSLNYGLLRLFQQSLVLVAPLIVVALGTLGAAFGRTLSRVGVAAVVTACFVSTSGLLPQFIGGYQPQLNLNNAGPYYRAWYAAAGDVALAGWAGAHLPDGAPLAADSAETALLRATTRFDPREGVAPGIVAAGAYLAVTVIRPERVQAVAVADDRILLYTFPLRCVATGRSLLYAEGEHRIYGPTS